MPVTNALNTRSWRFVPGHTGMHSCTSRWTLLACCTTSSLSSWLLTSWAQQPTPRPPLLGLNVPMEPCAAATSTSSPPLSTGFAASPWGPCEPALYTTCMVLRRRAIQPQQWLYMPTLCCSWLTFPSLARQAAQAMLQGRTLSTACL